MKKHERNFKKEEGNYSHELSKYYVNLYEAASKRPDVRLSFHPLYYTKGRFLFPKIVPKEISERDKIVMIGAGVHANEISGPITILDNFNKIVDYATACGVKIIFYPLRNPSSYGIPGKRYNADVEDSKVESGNNDFLRYILPNGKITGDLKNGQKFARFIMSSDPSLKIDLPPETRLMHDLLKVDPIYQVKGVIDLHQDYLSQTTDPGAYHYVFGDTQTYKEIAHEIEKIIPIWKNRKIGAGYAHLNEKGEITLNSNEEAVESDENGFIVRHDGTWPDLMYEIGESQGKSIYSVTPETTGNTHLGIACQVNMIWIKGIINLVAKTHSR